MSVFFSSLSVSFSQYLPYLVLSSHLLLSLNCLQSLFSCFSHSQALSVNFKFFWFPSVTFSYFYSFSVSFRLSPSLSPMIILFSFIYLQSSSSSFSFFLGALHFSYLVSLFKKRHSKKITNTANSVLLETRKLTYDNHISFRSTAYKMIQKNHLSESGIYEQFTRKCSDVLTDPAYNAL